MLRLQRGSQAISSISVTFVQLLPCRGIFVALHLRSDYIGCSILKGTKACRMMDKTCPLPPLLTTHSPLFRAIFWR
ncbi:MAG: hypothetical protein ACI9IV_001618, partial [Paracoccaceae bacterium]